MKSSNVFGGSISQKCELAIQNQKGLNDDALAMICEHIGGEPLSSNANVAFQIPFLPNFPVMLKICLPDETFPPPGGDLWIPIKSLPDH